MIWLTRRFVAWWTRYPTLILGDDESGECTVKAGHWRFAHGSWRPGDATPLTTILRPLIEGTVVWTDLPARWAGIDVLQCVEGAGWTTTSYLDNWHEYEARKRAQQEELDRTHRAHEVNIEMFEARLGDVAGRATAALRARGIAPTVDKAGKFTGFGIGLHVNDGLIVCEPVLGRLWPSWHAKKWGAGSIVVMADDAGAARARNLLPSALRVVTIASFEANPSLPDKRATPAPVPCNSTMPAPVTPARTEPAWFRFVDRGTQDLGRLVRLGENAYTLHEELVRLGIPRSRWHVAADLFDLASSDQQMSPDSLTERLIHEHHANESNAAEQASELLEAVRRAVAPLTAPGSDQEDP